jgi:hypothetical protein
MPVDQFLDTMGFFSASTNLNCIDCHGAAAGGDSSVSPRDSIWELLRPPSPKTLSHRRRLVFTL